MFDFTNTNQMQELSRQVADARRAAELHRQFAGLPTALPAGMTEAVKAIVNATRPCPHCGRQARNGLCQICEITGGGFAEALRKAATVGMAHSRNSNIAELEQILNSIGR